MNKNYFLKLAAMGKVIKRFENELLSASGGWLHVFISFEPPDEELFKKMVKKYHLTARSTGSAIHAENDGIKLIFWPSYHKEQNPEISRLLSELNS